MVTMILSDDKRIECLENGLWRAFCYKSGLAGTYYPNGSYKSGDLRLPRPFILSLMTKQIRLQNKHNQ